MPWWFLEEVVSPSDSGKELIAGKEDWKQSLLLLLGYQDTLIQSNFYKPNGHQTEPLSSTATDCMLSAADGCPTEGSIKRVLQLFQFPSGS